MKYLLSPLIAFVVIIFVAKLTACSVEIPEVWRVSLCPKDGRGCETGNLTFNSREECEDFAARASEVQPNIVRICSKAMRDR